MAIGDSYAGGIVFYLDGNGGGKVAANVDQGTSSWYTAQALIANSANYDAAGQAYNDWYFPSLSEVNLMWENLHRFGCSLDSSPCPTALGGLANGNYWSSTQHDFARAWRHNFEFNNQGYLNKGYSQNVRAVRVF